MSQQTKIFRQPAAPIQENELVTKPRLANVMGISERTVDRLVRTGELPAPFYQGRDPVWLGATLLKHWAKLQAKALAAAMA